MASRAMTKGTQRTLAHADIKHHIFPVALFLTREELMNSVRYNAKNLWIEILELADGNFTMRVMDDGTGDADKNRLTGPAESNGEGTARYAAGLPITRLKRANPGDVWSAAWKKAGEKHATCMDNNFEISKCPLAGMGEFHPWTKESDHGFVHTTPLRREKLNGVEPKDLVATLREILCASMTPAVLARLSVTVQVKTKDGVVSEENSVKDKWRTLEQALRASQGMRIWEEKTIHVGDVVMRVVYLEMAQKTKLIDFPHYGQAGTPHAMLVMDEFTIADMPLHVALKRKAHGSSFNRRYLLVTFSLREGVDNVELLPTPASTKTSFLPDCAIYAACMKAVTAGQPKGWAKWEAAPDSPPSDGPAPAPAPEPPAPKKKRGRPAATPPPAAALPPGPERLQAAAGGGTPPPPEAPKKTRIVIRKKAASPPAAPAPEPEPAPAPEVAEAVVPVVDPDVEWFHTVVARMRGVLERYPDLRTGLV
jgi:hypothetical protein